MDAQQLRFVFVLCYAAPRAPFPRGIKSVRRGRGDRYGVSSQRGPRGVGPRRGVDSRREATPLGDLAKAWSWPVAHTRRFVGRGVMNPP